MSRYRIMQEGDSWLIYDFELATVVARCTTVDAMRAAIRLLESS